MKKSMRSLVIIVAISAKLLRDPKKEPVIPSYTHMLKPTEALKNEMFDRKKDFKSKIMWHAI